MKNKQCFKSSVPSHKNLRWVRICCLVCEQKIDNVSADYWFHLLGKN